jgi:hypothetical protein
MHRESNAPKSDRDGDDDRAVLDRPGAAEEQVARPLRWSIRRAIDVLDEAIDRMGSQLARAAGSSMDWTVEPPGSQVRRPAVRAGKRPARREPASTFDVDSCEPRTLHGPELL